MKKKLAVCVPYRNRETHLKKFVPFMTNFLTKKGIPHEIFICHQNDKKLFNRGKLLNIAFTIARQQGFDYFAFHDVDMIPEDENCDYSYPENFPVHLAVYLSRNNYKQLYPEYFSGCVIFTKEQFEKINGYSNDYWGWGWEDDDLFYRVYKKGLAKVNYLPQYYPTKSAAVFNGKDSYIEVMNTGDSWMDFTRGFSLYIELKPEEKTDSEFIIGDRYQYTEVPVLSFDHQPFFSFNKFETYVVKVFDRKSVLKILTVRAPIYIKNAWSGLFLTVSPANRMVRLYMNGVETNELIGTSSPVLFENELQPFMDKTFIIGSYLHRWRKTINQHNLFKGKISRLCVWNRIFTPQEVEYQVEHLQQISADQLKLHYNFNTIIGDMVMDESELGHHGRLHHCRIEDCSDGAMVKQASPFRRNGKFYCMPHKSNHIKRHFFSRQIKQAKITAINEKIFKLDVRSGKIAPEKNGLSNLSYKLLNIQRLSAKYTMINVEC